MSPFLPNTVFFGMTQGLEASCHPLRSKLCDPGQKLPYLQSEVLQRISAVSKSPFESASSSCPQRSLSDLSFYFLPVEISMNRGSDVQQKCHRWVPPPAICKHEGAAAPQLLALPRHPPGCPPVQQPLCHSLQPLPAHPHVLPPPQHGLHLCHCSQNHEQLLSGHIEKSDSKYSYFKPV